MRFAIISDTHVVCPSDQPFAAGHRYAVDTWRQLDEALDALRRLEPAPDFILCGGDVSHDGTPETYELFLARLGQLGKPLYAIPGNHDLHDSFRAAFAPDRETPAGRRQDILNRLTFQCFQHQVFVAR